MSLPSFAQLGLSEPLLRALNALGHTAPTPIQAQAIPALLAGRDLLGCSQTGTGKTGAFALPILQRLSSSGRRPAPRAARALILTPTRELALQISESFRDYGRYVPFRMALVYGGVGQTPQVKAAARGVEVLVATPGRLLDLLGQGHLRLDTLEIFVLDEADRMLDMGFLPDIKRVLALIPAKRQSLFFSATMAGKIGPLAQGILSNPVKVEVTPASTPVERIEQRVLFVPQDGKRALLGQVLEDDQTKRVLVFTRTKHGADRVVRQLGLMQVQAEAIHGDKTQNARQAALANFRCGRTRVLVATDIAARGLDVEGITHVINYDLPMEPESYVHRIGRTGRAGADGVAISFCAAQEKTYLRNIERLIHQAVPCQDARRWGSESKPAAKPAALAQAAPRPRRQANRPQAAA